MGNTIDVNRGSDAEFRLAWPADLTGRALSLFEPHPAMAAHTTLTLESASASGSVILVRMEWSDEMPDGRSMTFRVRASLGGDDRTTNKLWINVI